jgi:antitoxin VapB
MGLRKKRAPARRPAATAGSRLRAKVFWTGRSQAVRIPKEMRFSTPEVTVRREGRRLILEPLDIPRDAKGWPTSFWALAGSEPDFSVGERSPAHERESVFDPGS